MAALDHVGLQCPRAGNQMQLRRMAALLWVTGARWCVAGR